MRRGWLVNSIVVLPLAILAGCGGGDAPDTAPAASVPAPAPAAPPAPGAAEGASELVAMGQQVYSGAGICFTCHGPAGVGTPLGPNLTDDEWLWIENPSEDLQGKIAETIRTGVPQPRQFPAPMPPMGGASLTEEQLQALAAYVASL